MNQLAASDIQKIQRMWDWHRQYGLSRQQDGQRGPARIFGSGTTTEFYAAPAAGIVVGPNPTNVASGTCKLFRLNQAQDELEDSGDTRTVFTNYTLGSEQIFQGTTINDVTFALSSVAKVLIQAPVNGIPARAGAVPGSANCFIVITDASGNLTVTTQQITVKNLTKAAVADTGDRYGMAAYHTGDWWVDVEDCNDPDP